MLSLCHRNHVNSNSIVAACRAWHREVVVATSITVIKVALRPALDSNSCVSRRSDKRKAVGHESDFGNIVSANVLAVGWFERLIVLLKLARSEVVPRCRWLSGFTARFAYGESLAGEQGSREYSRRGEVHCCD